MISTKLLATAAAISVIGAATFAYAQTGTTTPAQSPSPSSSSMPSSQDTPPVQTSPAMPTNPRAADVNGTRPTSEREGMKTERAERTARADRN